MAAGHDPAPAAVLKVLLSEASYADPRPVRHPQGRLEPDEAAALADPVVHLTVLGPQVLLVVTADPLDGLAAEHAQVNGVDCAGAAPGMEPGRAHPEWRGHGPRHCLLKRGDSLGRHDPADVDGAGLGERRYGLPEIAGRQQRVPV